MQRNIFLQNTKPSKDSNESNQEEDNGLHILKVLQRWNTDGVKWFNEQCAFVEKDLENKSGFDIDYHNIMKIQSNKATNITATLVAYDKLKKAFAEV